MRVCRSCGRENPDDRDFCVCGEYMRWEPTGFMPSVAPPAQETGDANGASPAGQPGAASAPVGSPQGRDAAAAPAADPNITLAAARIGSRGAPASTGGPGAGVAPPGAAALTVRLLDGDAASDLGVRVPVQPGARAMFLGLIRNQSEVVDNFDLSIRGLPDGWWTIAPATAYLVPYGTSGTYEQELQIHVHPPRTSQAQARDWSFEVVAVSRAHGGEVASAPATMTVGSYADIATELRPERVSGRLKARYVLTVRNKANARAEVDLAAEDTDDDCRFRFAQPRITLEPGNGIQCPFTVFPPKQVWIGRPKDRRFQVTASPVGEDGPPPIRTATFRQRSWLPWWLAIVIPLLVVAAVLVVKLLPKQILVPTVTGSPSVAAAQVKLAKSGFQIAPKATIVANTGKPAGSVAAQVPAAGTKAKPGTHVILSVFAAPSRSAKVRVPRVIGDTELTAAKALQAAGLTSGPATPGPPNPSAKVVQQSPFAGLAEPRGTPVTLFVAKPASSSTTSSHGTAAAPAVSPAAAAAAAGAASAATAAGGQATPRALAAAQAQTGKGSIAIPKLPADLKTASTQLNKLGLVPQPLKQLSTAPPGAVVGSAPAAGAKVAPGSTVDVLVSGGSPQLAFDNGSTVQVISSATGKASGAVPAGAGLQTEPSWTEDGQRLVYVQGASVMSVAPDVNGDVPGVVDTPPTGFADHDPAPAPTTKAILVAFIERGSSGEKLCFVTLNGSATSRSCTGSGGWDLGNQVAWSRDGKTILVFGARKGGTKFGLLAYTSRVADSPNATDWGSPTLQTDASQPKVGVIAGAFSPNGKQMALVSNTGAGGFDVYVVPAGDYHPTPAQSLQVPGCQVSWRSDGQALAVVQPSAGCTSTSLGTIFSVDPAHPGTEHRLATDAADPEWQPVPSGG